MKLSGQVVSTPQTLFHKDKIEYSVEKKTFLTNRCKM